MSLPDSPIPPPSKNSASTFPKPPSPKPKKSAFSAPSKPSPTNSPPFPTSPPSPSPPRSPWTATTPTTPSSRRTAPTAKESSRPSAALSSPLPDTSPPSAYHWSQAATSPGLRLTRNVPSPLSLKTSRANIGAHRKTLSGKRSALAPPTTGAKSSASPATSTSTE